MKRRTIKKRESRVWANEMRRIRRMRDCHYDAFAWVVIARFLRDNTPSHEGSTER